MDNVTYAIVQEIKRDSPNLVKRLIDKSKGESEWERQTIYGDLMDWLRDMYSVDGWTRDEIAKHLIADYVIKNNIQLG